jgi:hypothetical protein
VDIPKVPVAVTIFPGEIYRAPRSWAEQTFHNLIYWNEVDKGGHFAVFEQPEPFSTGIRADTSTHMEGIRRESKTALARRDTPQITHRR